MKYIKEHDYIHYYNEFFYEFNFTDFEDYCSDSKLDSYISYLDEHEKLATKKRDVIWKSNALLTYSNICASEGLDAFEKSIEEFCLRPVMNVKKIPLFSLFNIFEEDNIKNIKTFSLNHTIEDMDDLFNKYYSNDCKVSKSEMLDILYDILYCEDFFDMTYVKNMVRNNIII